MELMMFLLLVLLVDLAALNGGPTAKKAEIVLNGNDAETFLSRGDTIMKMKVIGYWTSTAVVAGVLLVDGVMGLVHIHGRVMLVGKPLDEVMERLGYPAYLLKILGVWKPLGAIALLVPRFPRLKEWAYAGTFINMTGAAASSVASGDDVGNIIWALIFTVLTLASWALRPQSRTLGVLFPAEAQSSNKGGIKPARACTDHPKKVA